MAVYEGRGVYGGRAAGPALVTRMPVNFTAAHTKPQNLLRSRRDQVQDRHHELYKQNIRNTILVFPSCIGSTYTGMVLLDLMYRGVAPAGLVVQDADSLLVSGVVLAQVWFNAGVPVVEFPDHALFDAIATGDHVSIDAANGTITVDKK